MNWTSVELWAKGLVAAVIGGAANAITLMVVDPAQFNIEDWHKLASVAVIQAVVSACLYLKQSPVPA